jgi:stalled ribosome rescue protein Dom34
MTRAGHPALREEQRTKVMNTAQVQASQTHSRAVIWIDHLTAKIFTMGLTGVTPSVVHAHLASAHLHHKANTIGSGHVADDPAFLGQIAKAVDTCTEVLILGPGTEKTALMHYLQSTHPQIALRVESSDHPSDAEIIAAGRKHFRLG